MTTAKKSGQAFPTYTHNGMSLRDYFAAQALQGMLADSTRDMDYQDASKYAYKYADAMLEASKL